LAGEARAESKSIAAVSHHLFNGIWSSIHCSASAARGKSNGFTVPFHTISHLPLSGLFLIV
jgi:hypothetical protein